MTEQMQQEQERDFHRAEYDLDFLLMKVRSGETTADDEMRMRELINFLAGTKL